MEWLAWETGLIATGITVPILVGMYFLKLKRREMLISSTFLWQRAVQDLQVNAPFQRLRKNLLLLIQLLILLLLLIALARPALVQPAAPAERYVLLIDRSASMNATDVAPSRLAEAKAQAKAFLESLGGESLISWGGRDIQAMVIAFDNHADVLCQFTSNRNQLNAAIDAITPSDGGSCLDEAVTVAQAFAQSPGDEANNRSAETPATMVLFSDGNISDRRSVVVPAGCMKFQAIGKSSDNTAVVAMQARRSYDQADEVDVFASLANYRDKAAVCDVQLSVDGKPRAVRQVTVPPVRLQDGKRTPGQLQVSFRMQQAAGGVVEVRQNQPDTLACDDTAWAVLPEPQSLRVLLVTSGNAPLLLALKACSLSKLDVMTPQKFDTGDFSQLKAAGAYDVIVLDGHAPKKLPQGCYLSFGPPPGQAAATSGGTIKNQAMIDWRQQHPVLQFVNMTELFIANAHRLKLGRDAEILCELRDGPGMAVVRRKGSVFLLVAFDVLESNWPFEPGFVMFCQNAIRYLARNTERKRQNIQVGEAISLQLPAGIKAKLTTPGTKPRTITADAGGVVRIPATSLAGVYRVNTDRQQYDFAVNILDPAESDIRPADEIEFSGQSVAARKTAAGQSNRELWPYLVAAVLFLVCLEWLVYKQKLKV
ncbi:MAG: VWA domain-containing protein [Phycisphaerae bacterium]|nr:VWA domain-containing protein [Phycisphaerae bacterium]